MSSGNPRLGRETFPSFQWPGTRRCAIATASFRRLFRRFILPCCSRVLQSRALGRVAVIEGLTTRQDGVPRPWTVRLCRLRHTAAFDASLRCSSFRSRCAAGRGSFLSAIKRSVKHRTRLLDRSPDVVLRPCLQETAAGAGPAGDAGRGPGVVRHARLVL